METHSSCLELCNERKDVPYKLMTGAKNRVFIAQNSYAKALISAVMVFRGD